MLFCLLRVIYSVIYKYEDNDRGGVLFVTGKKNQKLTAKLKPMDSTISSKELEIGLTDLVDKHKKITLEIHNSLENEKDVWEISSNPQDPCINIPYKEGDYANMAQLCLSRNYSVVFTKFKNGKEQGHCFTRKTIHYKQDRNILTDKQSDSDIVVTSDDLNAGYANKVKKKQFVKTKQLKKVSFKQSSELSDSSSDVDIREKSKYTFKTKNSGLVNIKQNKKPTALTLKAKPSDNKNEEDKTSVLDKISKINSYGEKQAIKEKEEEKKKENEYQGMVSFPTMRWLFGLDSKKQEDQSKPKEKKVDVLPIIFANMIDKRDKLFPDINKEEIIRKIEKIVDGLLVDCIQEENSGQNAEMLKKYFQNIDTNVKDVFKIIRRIMRNMNSLDIEISYEVFISYILKKIEKDEDKAKFADVMNMFLEHVMNSSTV